MLRRFEPGRRTSTETTTSRAVINGSIVPWAANGGVLSQARIARRSVGPLALWVGMAMVRVPPWYFSSASSTNNARTSSGVDATV